MVWEEQCRRPDPPAALRQRTEQENLALRERNNRLHADVNEIKNRVEAIEARAREQLGLIKPGETYYQVVLPDENAPSPDAD